MDKKLKKLLEEKEKKMEEVNAFKEAKIDEIIKKLIGKKIKEESVFSEVTEIMENSQDIVQIYERIVALAEKNNITLNKVKQNLAERYYAHAKETFLQIPEKEIYRALELFKELGDKKRIRECEKTLTAMQEVFESISLE